MYKRIIGIDPGSDMAGMTVLEDNRITGFELEYTLFWHKLTYFLLHPNCVVVVEDIRPYSLRLTPQVITTCKMIGELVYRLKIECGATVEMMVRNEVKKWVFDYFPDVCLPKVRGKIEKKDQRTAAGNFRSPSFVYVDDKIIKEAMKSYYQIPLPPPGKPYPYGLKDHSWQSLALATAFLHKSGSHESVT